MSRIDGEESKIDLGMAEQKLKVQEATVDLHAASDQLQDRLAPPACATRRRPTWTSPNRASPRWRSRRRSPAYLTYAPNYSQGWMNAKPFKVGDNVFSGMGLAEMPDLDTLMMDAKVEEIDRGRISTGKEVRVRVDSLPELTMPAKIGQISPAGGDQQRVSAHAQFSRLCAHLPIPIRACAPA